MIIECIGFIVVHCTIPDKPSVVVCPPVIEWRVDLQKRAAAELRNLPKGSALAEITSRAIEQRDVNRRCKASKKGPLP